MARRAYTFGLVAFAAVAMCAALLVTRAASQEFEAPFVFDATVTRVIDGSTLDAQVDGVRTAIGYLGLEAPPLNEPCGVLAMERNRELVGRRVRLISHAEFDVDPIGRKLYSVYTPEGISIPETLIREGLARAVDTGTAESFLLTQAQQEAEQSAIGCLWQQ
jgi:endonuclease YncB( thermonuclease family)